MPPSKAPPRVVRAADHDFQPRFAYGEMASAAQAVGPADGTALAAGFVRLSEARIPWTTRYDEVILVLEGALTVETESGSLHAAAGELVWLPEGTALTYVARKATCFYAIHPGDWAAGLNLAELGR